MVQLTALDELRYRKLLPWLTHPLAITDKLRNLAGDAVLHRLNEGWTTSNTWDNQHIISAEQSVWCREIIMLAQQQMCWYARSIFPESTYRNHPEFFAALNHVTLGDLIFKTSGVTRDKLMHYAIDENSLEYQWLPEAAKSKPQQVLWLRLAKYRIASLDAFYLVEIFLPAVEQYNE